MAELSFTYEDALRASVDEEINPELAAHCERAEVITPSGNIRYDVIFDAEASNRLCQLQMERIKQKELEIPCEPEGETFKSRLITWAVSIAIGLIIGMIWVAFKH